MALTFTKVAGTERNLGNMRTVQYDIAFDDSYPTGGESVAAASVGLRKIEGAFCIGGAAAAGALLWFFDVVNSKIVALQPTGGGGTNPTTLAAPIVSSGESTASAVDATTPTIVPGIGKEVADTADLSAYTKVRFIFFGE